MTEWRLVAILVLLALSAFFSGAETALFGLRQHQLQRLRTSSARAAGPVLALLERPRRLLSTVLVGNTIVNILMSALTTGLFVAWFGVESGTPLATLAATVVLLVFGEITPKALAVGRPLNLALHVARPLGVFQRLLAPMTGIIVRWTDAAGAAMARRVPPRDEVLSEDEIKTLVTMGWERGVVGAREKDFIHNVFLLDDRYVAAIVTPRSRVFAVGLESRAADVRAEVGRAGFSRIPVYSGSPENLVGYVEATDLLWGRDEPDPRALRELRRDLAFYPETKQVGELLVDMRRAGQEIAGVIDEHGDYAGIVSLEDAVEQVVGEIFDLHDLDRFRFTNLPDGDLLVAATMEIRVFNELLDVTLRDPHAETIGGFVVNQLRRIPEPGASIVASGLQLTVEQAAPNRILTLRIRRPAVEERR